MAWWVCGANVNKVLPLAMVPSRTALRSLVVYYGMPPEWPEPRADLGLFVVKAGRDWPDQNELIDRFVIDALRLERDLTLMVHPTAHAAFDVSDSNDRTRFILRHTLEYLKMQLSPQMRVEAELAVLERRAKAAFEEAMKSESKGRGPIDQTAWHRTADLYGQILEARPEFGEGWFRVGWAHLRLGSFDDAIVAFQSAADHGYWVAASTYNVACAAARNGELDRALEALQKALELGFEDSALLRGDPDLDNVRGDPRFQDLLNSWGIRGRRDDSKKKHAFQVTEADDALRN
jgi:tetratricopeptide (TPR) repeat protein